jgi:hypothetical protein
MEVYSVDVFVMFVIIGSGFEIFYQHVVKASPPIGCWGAELVTGSLFWEGWDNGDARILRSAYELFRWNANNIAHKKLGM